MSFHQAIFFQTMNKPWVLNTSVWTLPSRGCLRQNICRLKTVTENLWNLAFVSEVTSTWLKLTWRVWAWTAHWQKKQLLLLLTSQDGCEVHSSCVFQVRTSPSILITQESNIWPTLFQSKHMPHCTSCYAQGILRAWRWVCEWLHSPPSHLEPTATWYRIRELQLESDPPPFLY